MAMLIDETRRAVALLAARLRLGDRGASLVEYALLAALIAVVCVVAVQFFGRSTGTSISKSSGSIFTG
jgi:Flp pilus assembly pilin Flp